MPIKEIGDANLLPAAPFELVAGIAGVIAGGHICPVVHVLSPIIEKPSFVESLGGPESLLEVLDESGEDIRVRGAIG